VKYIKSATKQYITLHTTPRIYCRTTSRNCRIRIMSLPLCHRSVCKHGFSNKDKILIKKFYQLKGYKVTELMNEFPNKWCTKSSTRY